MTKLNLIVTVISAAALLAGAALAGHLAPLPAGPHSDAEWDGPLGHGGATPVLVAASFDPTLDADFLDTTGYQARGGAIATAACADACGMACGMDCGAACGNHCGATCGTR